MNFLDCLSSIEQLPRELVWKIIENVPESVANLRMTSRCLLSHVYEYAQLRNTIPLVDEMLVRGSRINPINEKEVFDDLITIEIRVPARTVKLFELRLQLHNFPLNLIDRRPAVNAVTSKCLGAEYVLSLSDGWVLPILRVCMGGRLGQLWIIDCERKQNLVTVSNLLEGVHFEKMTVRIDNISTVIQDNILNIVNASDVGCIGIFLKRNTSSDPVEFLLQLSYAVRSLYIEQQYDSRTDFGNYFFGMQNADWGEIMLDMFSINLNKLRIDNRHYVEYLNNNCVNRLRERLPLLDKKLWLSVCCQNYPKELFYTFKDNLVKVGNDGYTDSLRIVHSAREGESDNTYAKFQRVCS